MNKPPIKYILTDIERKLKELMAFGGKPAYIYYACVELELDDLLEDIQSLIDLSNESNQQRIYSLLQAGLSLKSKLAEYEETKNHTRKPLLLKFKKVNTVVPQEEVLYAEVSTNYCQFHCFPEDKKSDLITSKTLKDYESVLDSSLFYRISKKHLINVRKIVEIIDGSIKLQGGIILPLPKSNEGELKQRFIS